MIDFKDRIPTYPGRISLVPVEGEANTYVLTRADEPTEAGTAINRALMVSLAREKNILDNWDFRIPVNQRGGTSYSTPIAVKTYTIDRWYIDTPNSTLAVNSGFITITNTGGSTAYFRQQIDNGGLYNGRPLSFSADVKEYTGTVNMLIFSTSGSSVSASVTGAGINTVSEDEFVYGSNMQAVISLAGGSSISLYTSKLEIGEISTLANDSPANLAIELAKCQRFFFYGFLPVPYYEFIGTAAARALYCGIKFPVEMRIIPTILTPAGTISTTSPYSGAAGVSKNGIGYIPLLDIPDSDYYADMSILVQASADL